MPTVVTLPACLMDCYKVLYPNLDFSRVAFYSGLPTGLSAPDGFTMASGAAIPDIRVYIKDYKPCIKDTFLTIAHELVHVVQIQGMLGGGRIPGSWTAYYTSHFLGCAGRGSKCDNELEKEAYDFANGSCGTAGKVRDYVDTALFGTLPCNCAAAPWPIASDNSPISAPRCSSRVKQGPARRIWLSDWGWRHAGNVGASASRQPRKWSMNWWKRGTKTNSAA